MSDITFTPYYLLSSKYQVNQSELSLGMREQGEHFKRRRTLSSSDSVLGNRRVKECSLSQPARVNGPRNASAAISQAAADEREEMITIRHCWVSLDNRPVGKYSVELPIVAYGADYLLLEMADAFLWHQTVVTDKHGWIAELLTAHHLPVLTISNEFP